MNKEIENYLQGTTSKNTRKNYQIILLRFNTWTKGEIPAGLDWEQQYVEFLRGTGLGSRSINTNMVVIGNFFRKIFKVKINYQRLKEERKEVEFLEDNEVEILLKHADPEFLTILMFMLNTGVRVGELEELSRKEFTAVPKEFVITGKGRRQRVIVISEVTWRMVKGQWKNKLLFGRQWSKKMVERKLKKLAKRNGITKNVHPHILRHTMATQMLCKGADITEVQRMLGHANLNTTQIYSHITDARLRQGWSKYLEMKV